MTATLAVDTMRGGWLTLAFMMLLSRIAFQAAGPLRMRSFLDGWQSGGVKRVWGGATLCFAVFLLAAAVSAAGDLSALDLVLLVALLAVLVADGFVNVLPSGFETFKDRLQEAWVARRRGTGREGDRYLFTTVNALLAAAAVAAAGVVIAYRPIDASLVVVAALLAFVLTAVLVGASVATSRER